MSEIKTGYDYMNIHNARLPVDCRGCQLGTLLLTDYPFSYLGDEDNKPAPIRIVKFISYDNNKYVTIELLDGCITEVKRGYLFFPHAKWR